MRLGKIVMSVALAGFMLGFGLSVKPAMAQAIVACPPGYYYVPGAGCALVTPSNLNYSQLNYSYGSPPPVYAAPYANPYYADPLIYSPYAVIGGIGFRGGFRDHDGQHHR